MNIISVNGLESQAAKLLNFKEKLDVDLLDKVITSLYSGEGVQVKYKCIIVARQPTSIKLGDSQSLCNLRLCSPSASPSEEDRLNI